MLLFIFMFPPHFLPLGYEVFKHAFSFLLHFLLFTFQPAKNCEKRWTDVHTVLMGPGRMVYVYIDAFDSFRKLLFT